MGSPGRTGVAKFTVTLFPSPEASVEITAPGTVQSAISKSPQMRLSAVSTNFAAVTGTLEYSTLNMAAICRKSRFAPSPLTWDGSLMTAAMGGRQEDALCVNDAGRERVSFFPARL